jgi:multiple sugar transport system substrate-binding protein
MSRDLRSTVDAGMSRRGFLAASGGALAGISLLGLAGCGSGGEAADGELILSVSPFMEEVARKQTERFNAAHPDGPTVALRVMPEDTSQYFGQLRTQFQAGGNDIAVIAGDVIWPPQFAEPGWISDLSDRFTAERRQEFLPGTVAAMVYEDRVWGVPWFTDSGLLYYRQDLLEKAGFSDPPATWDELKEMAAKVQADGGAKHGLVFTGAIYEGGTVLGTEFIRGAGGDILDGKEVVIGAPEAIRGLTVQQSLVADGIAPEAVGNFKEDEASGAFLRGDAVFMRMWPYAYDLLSDPEQSDIETGQVGLAQIPVADAGVTPVNVGGGWNFYVNASAGDQDGAWALIEFMTAAEQQKETALVASLLPTRTAVYDDPEVLEQLPAVALGKEAILQTTTPPVSPYYSDLSEAMAKQFNANVLGSVTPEEAAATLQEELTAIVERGG